LHPAVDDAELAVIGSAGDLSQAPFPKSLLRVRALPALSLMYLGAIYGWYFYLTWLPTYLLEARGFDLAKRGVFSSLPLLGIAAGVFAGGWVSDHAAARYGSRARAWPGIVGFPLASVATIGAAVVPGSVPAALLLTAAAGLGALGVAPAWAVCLELGGKRAGVVSGTMNMFGNFGGTLCPIAVGACVKRFGSWTLALASVAVFYAVAAVMWAVVDVEPVRAAPNGQFK
jgi:ACS family glucarate transporter-like MFS transporter